MIIKAEHIPATVAGVDFEEAKIKSRQNIRVFELRIGRPDGRFDGAAEVVAIENIGGFRELISAKKVFKIMCLVVRCVGK